MTLVTPWGRPSFSVVCPTPGTRPVLVVFGRQNNEYPATVGQPILAAAGFQPASRAGAYVYFGAKKPPKRRLRAELPAPHNRQDFGRTTLPFRHQEIPWVTDHGFAPRQTLVLP
jgi:hypothetical protein